MKSIPKALSSLSIIIILIACCGTSQKISINHYYDYDANYPLHPEEQLLEETETYTLVHISYKSVHNQRVIALLSLPKSVEKPYRSIVFLHGVGDHKAKDYMECGNKAFTRAGFAVFRIDYALHGERKDPDFKFDLRKPYPVTTRDAITQTVFDLRRAVDYLQSRTDMDGERIGFMGISLGAMTGAIFCGVESRIKVPVLALAGGGLRLLFGYRMLSASVNNMLAPIEPLNFIDKIAPRPVLFINAEQDEIIPNSLAKKLHATAGEPKKIIWYPTQHRKIPLDDSFDQATRWFETNL